MNGRLLKIDKEIDKVIVCEDWQTLVLMIRTQLHWMKIACTDIYVLELNVKNPRPLCLYVPGINYISDRETQMWDFYLSPWAGWRGRHWQRRRGKWRAVWKFQGVCGSLWWASVSLLRCPTRWQLHQGSVPAHSLRKDYCLTGLGGLGTGAVWDKKMYIRDFWTLIFSLGQHNPSYIKRTIRAILKYYFNETSLHSSSVTALSWSGSKPYPRKTGREAKILHEWRSYTLSQTHSLLVTSQFSINLLICMFLGGRNWETKRKPMTWH